ncbi:MAG: SRPBCC family protein [Chloroflexi bacterium]|nr:SRPBCC family protein [Chloroflexota bacterium]MBV9595654.1 SRPBCC family protein [Chloroflexota bacterium]
MTTQTPQTSVRLQIVVAAPSERAFRAFVEDFDRIKPREHSLIQAPIAETVFEPRVGGHIFDRGTDGSECRWARVLVYDPPRRIVFSWDISPQWQIESDQSKTSEVEVRFIPEAPDRTRVELEHRRLDRHGAGWETEREAIAGDGGWPLYIRRFEEVVAA